MSSDAAQPELFFEREMTPFEAGMFKTEDNPRFRSSATVVYVLDVVPDWGRFVEAQDRASRLFVRLRQRVVVPPLATGNPVWAVDPDFDLGFHLRRVRVAPPGTMREVLDLAQSIAMTAFDRGRPLWETVLVEGLPDGRAAVIQKIHHAIIDGVGGMILSGLINDRERDPAGAGPMPDVPTPDDVTPLGLLRDSLHPRNVASGVGGLLGRARAIARRPDRALANTLDTIRSLGKTARAARAEPLPLMRGRSASWRFGIHEVRLTDLKRAGKAAGGSVNDTYLAAIAGALRLYHEHFGAVAGEMTFGIPINLRTDDDPLGGNRWTAAQLPVPVNAADPRERVQRIHDLVLTRRTEPAPNVDVIAPLMRIVPTWLLGSLMGDGRTGIDVQASNVPGDPEPSYMAGAGIIRMYPFGPLPGCAVMVTMLSHVGTCCIGTNVDAAAVTEPEVFFGCMRRGFDEVLALGRPGPAPGPTRSLDEVPGVSQGRPLAGSASAARADASPRAR